MMIDKRLIGTVPESRKYIAANVTLQWCGLVANVAMMMSVASLLASQLSARASSARLLTTAAVAAAAVLIRWLCTTGAARMSDLSSRAVKKNAAHADLRKLLRLGASYSEQVSTAEVVQVAVEGVDQLETYFGAYLPQFFYAMLAPLTLFAVLCFVNMPAAFALLVCVPLIPVAIAAVQTWAKKLLSRYWGQYTKLGDTFLENLQGLTTLKIYQADGLRNDVMNEEAEKFRKITMKVLTMQLNSVTIMDVIAYGGAALGVILAATQYRAGHVALSGALLIILLSADFFHSHAAVRLVFPHCHERHGSKRKRSFACSICRSRRRARRPARTGDIVCRGLHFSYTQEREILHGLDLAFPAGSFTSIVGASGCGKSTIASILMGRSRGYTGAVTVGGVPLADISEDSLMRHITYVSHQSYLFKGHRARKSAHGAAGRTGRRALGRAAAGEACGVSRAGAGAGYTAVRAGEQPLRRPAPAAGTGPRAAA